MANGKPCAVDGCKRVHKARGYCSAHYYRFRRHGDPLAGRTPEGVPQRFYDEIVIPYTGDECIFWPFGKSTGGYGLISRNGRMRLVTRLVCDQLYGPPPTEKHVAAHSCNNGKHGCVSPAHLRWATVSENWWDTVEHGTAHRGENHSRAKLTEDDVLLIRAAGPKVKNAKLAKRFGVAPNTIAGIRRGRTWRHLETPADLELV